MSVDRRKCENFARCGETGHYRDGNVFVRCACLQLEMNKAALGSMYTPFPLKTTGLETYREQDLVLSGQLGDIRRHVSRVLLDAAARGQTWLTMDAYRLIEIFLDLDEQMKTTSQVMDQDILILLLGFGDPRNRYLPELVIQAIARRQLIQKPTWVVLGLPLTDVSGRYSVQLAAQLTTMKQVQVQE